MTAAVGNAEPCPGRIRRSRRFNLSQLDLRILTPTLAAYLGEDH